MKYKSFNSCEKGVPYLLTITLYSSNKEKISFAVFSAFCPTAVDDVAEVELGFLVVGGKFDVFLPFLVFHPEFVVRPGADDVPCVPIGRNVVGMGAVVHDAGNIWAVGVALDEGQHDFSTFV